MLPHAANTRNTPRRRSSAKEPGEWHATCMRYFHPGKARRLARPDHHTRVSSSGRLDMLRNTIQRAGNLRWGLIALLLGAPLPIVLLVWLFVGR
jgi:hypothetical protein